MTNIRSLVDNIVVSNNVSAQEKIADIMAEKLQTLLDLAKIEVAQGMFNTCEDCSEETLTQEQYDGLTEEEQADFELIDEALSGNQHKIDANKNGKVDGHDFKLLRKKKGVKEEAEQVDEDTFEQGGKMKTDTKPRHVSPHFKHLKKRSYDEIRADALKNAGLTDVSKKSPAVKKEEVAHEAYSDPYAAKKSAEMKKAHAATMADAKKEYDAARKPKFAKNFMKMKKEEVELEEGNAENKMKKNAYADAKGAANKNLDRGSQRRVDSRRTDEVDSIKKGIDNYAPKKAAVRNIIRGKVFGKLSDTETKMFARKRVQEDVNLQELDDTTTVSYLQKRHGMKTLTHFKPENKVSAKSEKGKTNALASIEKKREAEREISRKATKKAGMGAAADYKKGTYSGD